MSHRPGSRRRRVGSVLVLSAALTASGVAIATPAGAAPVLPATPGSVVGLEYGDYGPEVRLLQEALIRVGVGVVHGVDGYFGSATRASVRAWQNHKGMPVTGTVDEATAVSLNLATAAPAAAASAPSGVLAVGARGPGRGRAAARTDQPWVRAHRWRRRHLRCRHQGSAAALPDRSWAERVGARRCRDVAGPRTRRRCLLEQPGGEHSSERPAGPRQPRLRRRRPPAGAAQPGHRRRRRGRRHLRPGHRGRAEAVPGLAGPRADRRARAPAPTVALGLGGATPAPSTPSPPRPTSG